MRFLLAILCTIVLSAFSVLAQTGKCQCYDVQACPADVLDPASLCACKNQAELFCWRRSGRNTCAKPIPYDCENLAPGGKATARLPTTAEASPPTSTFIPPPGKSGAGGLNCVDIGYCSRAPKSRQIITLTMPNGTAVITVPAGLPTDALPTLGNVAGPKQTAPVIVFEPEMERRFVKKEERAPMTALPVV